MALRAIVGDFDTNGVANLKDHELKDHELKDHELKDHELDYDRCPRY